MTPAVNPRLVEQVAAYLAHARVLGLRYRQEEWLLHTLLRELPALGHADFSRERRGVVRQPPASARQHAPQVGSAAASLLPVPPPSRSRLLRAAC